MTFAFYGYCMHTVIHIQHANLNYAECLASHDPYFDLMPATWTCLLGSRGSGKSSLIPPLCSFITSANQAEFTYNTDEIQQHTVYLCPSSMFLPWLYVLDNLMMQAHFTTIYHAMVWLRYALKRGDGKPHDLDLAQSIGTSSGQAFLKTRLPAVMFSMIVGLSVYGGGHCSVLLSMT